MPRLLIVGALAAIVSGCGGPGPRPGTGDGGIDPDVAEPECSEGNHRCAGSTYLVCSGGRWVTQQDCESVCHETLGCVACTPNLNVCDEGNVHACSAAGEIGAQIEECTGALICQSGACVNACDDAAMKRSYTGCEYWAVDLDNAVEVLDRAGGPDCGTGSVVRNLSVCSSGNVVLGLCDPPNNTCPSSYTCGARDVCVLDAQHAPFAVVVSNPQARSVDVTLTGPEGTTITRSIAAGQVEAIVPQPTIPDQSVDGTGKERKAYKLESNLPIVAYQFNPLDNVNVFSNDASLLVPRAAFDTEYYVMSFATSNRRVGNIFTGPGPHDYHGYVSVVAWQDGTQIEVTPKVAVRASATQAALPANVPATFTLNAFEVLTLQALAPGDLTGTKIKAVNTNIAFGVFGGHEAAGFGENMAPDQIHTSGPCCADHVEEMLFPSSTWGRAFAIARSESRGTNEPDVVRILAQKPNTTVQFLPPPVAGSCGTLGPGQFCQVKILADTSITTSEPVLIGHYLQSAIWQDLIFETGSIGEGDPSMAIAVPTEQYRTDYTVLVPAQYAKNYLSISAGSTGAIVVDGAPVTMTPFANGTYRAARVMVSAGQHKISCPSGCGVEVYGYGDAVSYMFAGGLDLKQIVIN
ncbi:MAG: IgGFc-binding protein [Kofleriaceae bacterium]|nr:IgGFc-binding protein [Kofleriaceae bacterium]